MRAWFGSRSLTGRSRGRAGSRRISSCSARWSTSRGDPTRRTGRYDRALGGRGGSELRCLRLLARRGVPVERTARGRAVDRADEFAVLRRDPLRVAVRGSRLEALRQRLDGRAVAEVLEALTSLSPYTLALLLDVRHSKKG